MIIYHMYVNETPLVDCLVTCKLSFTPSLILYCIIVIISGFTFLQLIKTRDIFLCLLLDG